MNRSLMFRSLLIAWLLVCAGASRSFAQQQPAGDTPPAVDNQSSSGGDQDADDADDEPTDDTTTPSSSDDQQPANPDAANPDAANPDAANPDAANPDAANPAPTDTGSNDASGRDQDVPPSPTDQPSTPPQSNPDAIEPIETPDQQGAAAGESPISDLADKTEDQEFVPLEDSEEAALKSLTPAEVYPYVDWDGYFRLRSNWDNNFDLDTSGTSAVPPPISEFVTSTTASDEPVDAGSNSFWTTNIRLRLEPTINITEQLRLHVEADILDNIVLGTRYEDSNFIGVPSAPGDDQPMIHINEGWAEATTFFGTLRAGRTDDDWGLGIFKDDGDCLDCNVENPIDRVSLTSKPLWGTYVRLSTDFPGEGASTHPLLFGDQPYDVDETDDVDQYTLALFRAPVTETDRQKRAQKLRDQNKPVLNGGLYFTYRSQSGFFSPAPTTGADAGELDQLDQGLMVYRGLNLYIPDVWFEMLYNPDPNTRFRVGLEAVGVLGAIDNSTRQPVGTANDGESVNCFDGNARDNNEQACISQGAGQDRQDVSEDIRELGVALETELYLGGPVRYGLNAGYASGGSEANWGYETDNNGNVRPADGAGLDFYRFHPNYQVDLIMFHQVLGTVTNAFYGNPWAQVRFLGSAKTRSHMEVQLDAIVSAAANPAGTPSAVIENESATGGNRMLGLELDAAARYIETERFKAELEGGILFPFSGLAARTNGRRLVQVGNAPAAYGSNIDPSVAWTLQGNLYWTF